MNPDLLMAEKRDYHTRFAVGVNRW